MFEINTYYISTGLGIAGNRWKKLPMLDPDDIKILDDIGYGSNKKYASREDYLNQRFSGRYQFKVIQTRFDSGDFYEEFLVITVRLM